MNRATHHSTSRHSASAAVAALVANILILACAPSLPASPAPVQMPCFRPGLRNSPDRPLTPKQLRILLEGLRLKTGFVEMRFDQDGFLTLGDRTHIAGGSTTARELIIAAVDSHDSFRLENHDQSPAVAFARIQPTEDYVDAAGIKHEVWSLKLDFHDFTQLRGGAEALTAFDPAMNLLHELGHGVLRLHDSISETDPLGDCEQHINQIRRDLGLPERQSYEPQTRLAVTPDSTAPCLLAELTFVRAEAGKQKSKTKSFSLFFNTEKVSIAAKAKPPSGRRTEIAVARG